MKKPAGMVAGGLFLENPWSGR